MDKKTKHYFLLVAFGIVLFAVLMNASLLTKAFGTLWRIVYPVVLAGIFAFMLNVPMGGIERWLGKCSAKWKRPLKQSPLLLISLLLTVISVLLVVALVFVLVIPAVAESVTSLYNLVMDRWPQWAKFLAGYGVDTSLITQWLDSLDLQKLISQVTSGAGNFITSTVGTVSNLVTGVGNVLIAFILACYMLLAKKDLARQSTKLVRAFLKPKYADLLLRTAKLTQSTYSKFLSGQCVEAVILGVLIFLTMTVFGIPYAGLVGVLTAFCAFIPYIGSFASCVVGAFLVLLTLPDKVILFIILTIVVQFIETQFIYPHVVGSSVGLSPLWTLVAVLIGGKLMGIVGMIFFIPLVSVFIALMREYTNKTLAQRKTAADEPSQA